LVSRSSRSVTAIEVLVAVVVAAAATGLGFDGWVWEWVRESKRTPSDHCSPPGLARMVLALT
jgi:hypothetical protein